MHEPRCDFYDWVSHRTCNRPAAWLTHQRSVNDSRSVHYYCDAHRPPRAHPLGSARPSREVPGAD
ncbi:MAG TPA: hypothetical protein VIW28_06190 [Gemmatimonadales bacterium]|jgi:hypothetical protein